MLVQTHVHLKKVAVFNAIENFLYAFNRQRQFFYNRIVIILPLSNALIYATHNQQSSKGYSRVSMQKVPPKEIKG